MGLHCIGPSSETWISGPWKLETNMSFSDPRDQGTCFVLSTTGGVARRVWIPPVSPFGPEVAELDVQGERHQHVLVPMTLSTEWSKVKNHCNWYRGDRMGEMTCRCPPVDRLSSALFTAFRGGNPCSFAFYRPMKSGYLTLPT